MGVTGATRRTSTRRQEADVPAAATEQRLVRVVTAAAERARKRADQIRAQREGTLYYARQRLRQAEDAYRELSQDVEYLTDYGRDQREGARLARQAARFEIENARRAAEKEAAPLTTAAAKAEKSLRRSERLTDPAGRLAALLEAARALDDTLTLTERRSVWEAQALLTRLQAPAAAPRQPEAAQRETGDEQGKPEAAPSPALAYLPEPAPILFDEGAAEIVARLAEERFEPEPLFRLNLEAQRLSLVEGFDALLCLQAIRDVTEYPHQVDTARQVLRRMRGRALLCDEVGLGKTIEAGLILKELMMRGLARRVLILTPPALVAQWQEEMSGKFGIECVTHDDPEFRARGGEAWGEFDRIIASISTAKLTAHSPHILKQSFDVIVVDEAHHLKSRTSLAWKFVNQLPKKYVLLLTATPVQNNLDELYNLITLLSPGQLKTVRAFRQEFVQRGDPRMPKNQVKLRELLMDVMVRNTRSQVHIALPRRHAHTAQVKLHQEEGALYEEVARLLRSGWGDGRRERLVAATLQAEAGSSARALAPTLAKMAAGDGKYGAALRQLAEQARAVSAFAKADALLTILRRHSEKTIVFTRFRETQRYLAEALDQAGIGTALFSSELSRAEKEAQIALFANERPVLLSTDVGSEGRNLQFCHALVNYDLPWNPMKIEQRVGRIHRIGQTEEVHIYNLAGRDTIEDYILQVLDTKINMFELVVGEIGMILGNLEDEREFDDLVLDLWLEAESTEKARDAFNALGDRMVAARQEYQRTQAYDAALFAEEFVAEQ
ncbi:MAG: DEAD/DEAH box helicase family protein [Armatimonadetes bacterium]|nr:DEAD/DEAH box helicase family protein [Armatimonadota bacterium]